MLLCSSILLDLDCIVVVKNLLKNISTLCVENWPQEDMFITSNTLVSL